MIYRKAEYGDLAELLRLYRQLETGGISSDAGDEDADLSKAIAQVWEHVQGKKEYAYFVAEEAGTLAGSCNITIVPNLTRGGRPFGVIENVITDASFRRRGVGRTLIEMAVEYAKDSNCYKVQLLSGSARTDAHRFYESLGFSGSSKKGFDMRL